MAFPPTGGSVQPAEQSWAAKQLTFPNVMYVLTFVAVTAMLYKDLQNDDQAQQIRLANLERLTEKINDNLSLINEHQRRIERLEAASSLMENNLAKLEIVEAKEEGRFDRIDEQLDEATRSLQRLMDSHVIPPWTDDAPLPPH
jgi:uncharacterized coiled-coil protein SlyX